MGGNEAVQHETLSVQVKWMPLFIRRAVLVANGVLLDLAACA